MADVPAGICIIVGVAPAAAGRNPTAVDIRSGVALRNQTLIWCGNKICLRAGGCTTQDAGNKSTMKKQMLN